MEVSVDNKGGFVLSTTTTPSQSDTKGSNENELKCEQLSSKLHNLKKPLTKHFMSPTISAATKAASSVPRKKILADSSNFNFDTHLQKTPNLLDSRNSCSSMKPRSVHSDQSSSSRLTPSQSRASKPDDNDDEHNVCGADSSLKPYDPVTSYTSPRPKFLRYNPKRLQQAFLPQENETSKEDDVEFDARRRMCFDSQIAAAEEKAIADALNSVVDEEVEFEGDQDNNGEEQEEEIEEIEEESGGSLKGVLKFLLVIVALFFSTVYISSMNSLTPSPTVEAIRGLKHGYFGIQNKVFEAVNLKIFEGGNGTMERYTDGEVEVGDRAEDDNRGLVESSEELGEAVEVQNGQSEDLCENELESDWEVSDDQLLDVAETEKSDDVFDHEVEGKDESFDHLVGRGLGESSEGAISHQEIEKTVESSDQFKETESFQDHQIAHRIAEEGAGEEIAEDQIGRAEEINSNGIDKFGTSARGDEESDTLGAEKDSKEVNIKSLKIESFPISIVGVPILLAIVATLGLVYWSRHKKTSAKDSPRPIENPIAESVIAEKISLVLGNVEQEEKIKKTESNVSPSSVILGSAAEGVEEASKEFSHSHLPTVELLGELVIGEVSSSLKSYGVKSKLLETEESNNSVSQEKMSYTKASVVEFSTADSPSYRSFTGGKKIAKKEEGFTTPVRRSSRLRNRAVMSP